MKIIFFTHPSFASHQSMPRFAKMLTDGMKNRGHDIDMWAPNAFFVKFFKVKRLEKWLGYIDQYIIFPFKIKKHIKTVDIDTLFVFCDHALGPWVPYVKKRPNVIHCHDFLAQQSALGQIAFNKLGFTGKIYQKLIRKGYSQSQNFISVSKKTKSDLHLFLNKNPKLSEVVYNGLNRVFNSESADIEHTRKELSSHFKIGCDKGYILHIGGNQWYKNRVGVIEIYNTWRTHYKNTIPLILIGEMPDQTLLETKQVSAFKDDIIFLSGVSDTMVNQFYSSASVFLFPSLAEGFGWPIAEAMASGSLVITTNEAPMNEVGGDAAFYIAKMPIDSNLIREWTKKAALVMEEVVNLSSKEKLDSIAKGIENAERFNQDKALDKIEKLYQQILEQHKQ